MSERVEIYEITNPNEGAEPRIRRRTIYRGNVCQISEGQYGAILEMCGPRFHDIHTNIPYKLALREFGIDPTPIMQSPLCPAAKEEVTNEQ